MAPSQNIPPSVEHEKLLEEWSQFRTPGFDQFRRSYRVLKGPHPKLPTAFILICAEKTVKQILSQCNHIGIAADEHKIENVLTDLFEGYLDGSCFGSVSRLLMHCDKENNMTAAMQKLKGDYSNILIAQALQKFPSHVKLKDLLTERELSEITYSIRSDNFRCAHLKMMNQLLYSEYAACHHFYGVPNPHIAAQIANNQMEIDALLRKADDYEKLLEGYPEKVDIIAQLLKDLRNLGIDPERLSSTTCPMTASEETYRTTFEALVSPFPEGATIRGTIDLPGHIIAFEKTPEGLYLFDTIRGKPELFYFSNEDYPKCLHQFIKYDMKDTLNKPDQIEKITDGTVRFVATSFEMTH
jgi:hypothetical protein